VEKKIDLKLPEKLDLNFGDYFVLVGRLVFLLKGFEFQISYIKIPLENRIDPQKYTYQQSPSAAAHWQSTKQR
jgi:hypothetical protein